MQNLPTPAASTLAVLVTAVALLATACGGGDGAEDTTAGGDVAATDTPADPDNCPTDALADAEGVTEVTVWHPYTAKTQETLETAAADYNASQDAVRVSVEAQGTYPELLKKYQDTLADPDRLPDVVFAEDTHLQFMIDSGSVIPAADCIAADPDSAGFYEDLLPAVENAYTVGGRLWAAAFGVSMPIMYVNDDHLRRAGLDDEQPPETLEEVREVAEAIAAADIPGVDSPVVMQLYGWFPENWLTGAGVPIVDNDNGRSALATESLVDSPEMLEVVEWIDQMAADGLLRAYPYSADISQFLALGQQSASILIDGSRAITTVDAVVNSSYQPPEGLEGADVLDDAELTGLDVSVAPVPGLEEPGQGAVWGSAAFLVAGEDPARIAGAWDFLSWFNSAPTQVAWTLDGSYLPVTEAAQSDPELTAYFTDTVAGQWLSTVNDQLLAIDPEFPDPAMGPYNEFRSGLHSMLDDVVLGSGEPEPALAAFDEEFQAALDRYAEEVR